MCLFFLLQYFPAVITVQISQRTLITLMAISWELVLKYQAKFIPKHHRLVLPTHSQTHKQPRCQIVPCPSSPQSQRCHHSPTPDSNIRSASSDTSFLTSPAKAKMRMCNIGQIVPGPGLISSEVFKVRTNRGYQLLFTQ